MAHTDLWRRSDQSRLMSPHGNFEFWRSRDRPVRQDGLNHPVACSVREGRAESRAARVGLAWCWGVTGCGLDGGLVKGLAIATPSRLYNSS